MKWFADETVVKLKTAEGKVLKRNQGEYEGLCYC